MVEYYREAGSERAVESSSISRFCPAFLDRYPLSLSAADRSDACDASRQCRLRASCVTECKRMRNQKWAPERVIEQIRALVKEGADLRHGAVATSHQKLVSAAIRYFGSWGAAVNAAGVDYNEILRASLKNRAAKVKRWSRDSILEGIRELASTNGSLAASSAREKNPALFSAAVSARYFGSWRKAVTAAGFDYDEILAESRKNSSPSETRGLRTVVRRMRVIGRPARELSDEQARLRYPRLYDKACSLFGSWDAAVEAAFEEITVR